MDPNTRALMMGAAGAGGAEKTYIEDVFSTWLYTGNGSTQTITNGIDLSGKGGLVWIKKRAGATAAHVLFDTARGASTGVNPWENKALSSVTTGAEGISSTIAGISAFNSSGFTLAGDQWSPYNANGPSSETYASWTFRKAPGFFDVVTWVGNGVDGRTISHSLGSTPGCIIVKATSATSAWGVYHRGTNGLLRLQTTGAADTNDLPFWFGNATTFVSPTSSQFTVAAAGTNANGVTYVAYLFAHDAQLFGDGGNQSVIKCGSFTGQGQVDLGWEPQFLLVKPYTETWDWSISDFMRGMPVSGGNRNLAPNTSAAEAVGNLFYPNATGFYNDTFGSTFPCIYIAIRRGPMKTPTDATKVFAVDKSANSTRNFGIVPDMVTGFDLTTGGSVWPQISARLTGNSAYLQTSSTAAQGTFNWYAWDKASGLWGDTWGSAYVNHAFRRAPGFFDVVAYTGTGTAGQTISHNLGVLPELLILKARVDDSGQSNGLWGVAAVNAPEARRGLYLNSTSAGGLIASALGSGFSSSTTTFNAPSYFVSSAKTYIAYLFASCPGISKVGSYTGTGTTLSIDCGFTNGSRLVLIKRTDSTGNWYIWDSARGIVSANDPYLLLNSTAAEVTNTDYIDPLSSGFQISSTAPAEINANGGSYIFLAVA